MNTKILKRALEMGACVIMGVCWEDKIMHHCPCTKCGATKDECIQLVTKELILRATAEIKAKEIE